MKKIVSIILSIMLIFQTTFGATLTVIINGAQITSTREVQEEVELTSKLDRITGWKVNTENVTIENNKFIMPNEDVEIEAILSEADKYELTVENMYVTTAEGKEEGKDVTVTATSSDEYTFISWTATGITLNTTESRSQTIEFTMPGNAVTLTANYMIAVKPDTSGANEPVLGTGMIPVNWNGYEFVDTTEAGWQYNYNSVASELSNGRVEGNGNGAWANARTADGSTWVWIPRYTYKILSGEHQTVKSWNSDLIDGTEENVGRIAVKFSTDTIDNISDGYIKHPAFTFGDDELEGIWVSKYEMSMVDAGGNNIAITKDVDSDVLISSTVKMVSKPNMNTWRVISTSNMFTNPYNYNRSLDSHLMKNSEFGAVTYLTNAIGRMPYSNPGYKSGVSASTPLTANSTASYYYNEANGVKASSTHNIYGVYDLCGGGYERVAAYYSCGDTNDAESTYLGGDTNNEYLKALYDYRNTKYVEVYATENVAYDSTIKGDAMYETSAECRNASEQIGIGNGKASWDNGHSVVPYEGTRAFNRGNVGVGSANTGSIFGFHTDYGGTGDYAGFRTVLAPNN